MNDLLCWNCFYLLFSAVVECKVGFICVTCVADASLVCASYRVQKTSWLSKFLPALFAAYLNTVRRNRLTSLGKMDLHKRREAVEEGAGGRETRCKEATASWHPKELLIVPISQHGLWRCLPCLSPALSPAAGMSRLMSGQAPNHLHTKCLA